MDAIGIGVGNGQALPSGVQPDYANAQIVAIGSGALATTAFATGATVVSLRANVACWYKVAGTAAANTAGSDFLPANLTWLLRIPQGATISFIQNTVGGYVSVTPMAGDPSLPGPSVVASTPLDIFPGAAFAYSYRKIRAAYGGVAIQARRDSDNVTFQSGFLSNGDWDIPSYHVFIGAGTAHTQIWYDQSGNGNDQSQLTAANQGIPHSPTWPTNNIGCTQNNIASSTLWYSCPDAASIQNLWTGGGFLALVYEWAAGSTNTLVSKGNSTGGWLLFDYNNAGTHQVVLQAQAPTTNASTWANDSVSGSGVRHVVTVAWNSATPATPAVITLDGVTTTLHSSAAGGGAILTDVAKGGVEVINDLLLGSNVDCINGSLYECIGWKTQPSAGVQTSLINNLRTYYGTP